MILAWTDQDGDQVAVESASIVGVSVGRVTGPHDPKVDVTVTLVWCAGIAQPFMVAEPFEDVFAAWQKARYAGPPPEAQGAHGWPMQYPHPSSVLPGAPTWASKGGAR